MSKTMKRLTRSPIMRFGRGKVSALVPHPEALVTDAKRLASYNWIAAKTPTIVVPGLPPIWRKINVPSQVKKDNGLVYTAQNNARHPESPLEPLFRALYLENPSFDISSVDVVSDRSNILKLLSFVDPRSNIYGVRDFSMRMELVDGTAIFHRLEAKTKEFIRQSDETSVHGREFKKAYTHNEVPSRTGHQRIVSYRLGDFRLVIRHEVDGYFGKGTPTQFSKQESAGNDFSGLLEPTSISQATDAKDTTSASSKLTVCRGGRSIALRSTLGIKTRVRHKPIRILDVVSQLWLSQTSMLVRAYHNRGLFDVPVVQNVPSVVKRWERNNQESLGRLLTLLINIIAVGKQHGHVSIKYSASKDKLCIYRCAEVKKLPEDLYQKWKKDGESRKSDQA
jgi:hypothetical protein